MSGDTDRAVEAGRDYAEIALERARRFDANRATIDTLPAHASQFELAGAVAADTIADVATDRCAYDRRILLVTLDSAISALASSRPAAPDSPDQLRALTAAFHAMDAACKWAAGETAGVKTIEDANRHTAGFDALLDATVKAGQAAGLLSGSPSPESTSGSRDSEAGR